jgi:hypothetical protein
MPEIDAIIEAVTNSYRAFAAANPDSDIRVPVSNAVRFLVADLTSATQYAANTKGN